jgi:hypothetical protein
VVLDLGESNSVIAAVLPGGGFYARNLGFTGRSVFARGDGSASPEEARARLREHPGAATLPSPLEGPLADLASEVRETLRFLGSRPGGRNVSRIHLCGGESLWPGLAGSLGSLLGVEALIPDPLTGIEIDGEAPGMAERARLAGAVGLARRWEE